MILADQVEIVLVLRDDELVFRQTLGKALEDRLLTEESGVDQQQTRVEEVVARNAHDLLGIGAVMVGLHHRLLVTRADPLVAQLGAVQLADIALHDGVAVDVDDLVILGEHIRDEQAEVGGIAVVITHGKRVGDSVQTLADVGEDDVKMIVALGELGRLSLCFGRNTGVQDINAVVIIG